MKASFIVVAAAASVVVVVFESSIFVPEDPQSIHSSSCSHSHPPIKRRKRKTNIISLLQSNGSANRARRPFMMGLSHYNSRDVGSTNNKEDAFQINFATAIVV